MRKREGRQVPLLEAFHAVEAMSGVRIAPDAEAEGAVAALWRALKRLEWSARVLSVSTIYPGCPICRTEYREKGQKHAPDCDLDAALARFEVEADGGEEG
jgi:hypothetical protein